MANEDVRERIGRHALFYHLTIHNPHHLIYALEELMPRITLRHKPNDRSRVHLTEMQRRNENQLRHLVRMILPRLCEIQIQYGLLDCRCGEGRTHANHFWLCLTRRQSAGVIRVLA